MRRLITLCASRTTFATSRRTEGRCGITENDQTEHSWLVDLTYRGGQFEGTINNEPGIVSNVRLGDRRKVQKSAISDWMYMRNGKIYGNYTMRPLLDAMPEEEARQYRSMFAIP